MGTVSSLFVRKMVAAAGPDCDGPALLASVGIDATQPPDPKLMIADTSYYGLLETISQQIDATDWPLRTGHSMRCDDYGALGLAFKAAPTLRGSFTRVARYARLWTSVVEYTLEPDGQDAWFVVHRTGRPRLGLHLSNEATLASAVAIAREVTQAAGFAPMDVQIKHPPPRRTARHDAYFGCRVQFNAHRNALLLSEAALATPNILGDSGLTAFLTGHLDEELSRIRPAHSLRDQLQDVISRSFSEGSPGMEDVARRLGMSARSLHRKLAEEGLTFQTLTQHIRQDLAEGLLRDARYSLAEVAFLTGFAEQSSFTRAFKRWRGQTPASFRKAAQD